VHLAFGGLYRLAGLLVNRLGAQVWLVGTKTEAPLGEALREGLTPAQRERVINLQGRTDLLELAERLREAHLLVSGDTGILHIAATLGTRTVAMFLRPASCFETGPYGEGHYVLQAEPPCHPCTEAGAACPEPICQAMIPRRRWQIWRFPCAPRASLPAFFLCLAAPGFIAVNLIPWG
jgi:ADP-heptose:LPS heptosyltransferase